MLDIRKKFSRNKIIVFCVLRESLGRHQVQKNQTKERQNIVDDCDDEARIINISKKNDKVFLHDESERKLMMMKRDKVKLI